MCQCRCAQSRTLHGQNTSMTTHCPDTHPRTMHRSALHHTHRCTTERRTQSHSSRMRRPDTARSSTCHDHCTHPTTLTGTPRCTSMTCIRPGTYYTLGRSRSRAKCRCRRCRRMSMRGRYHVRCTGCCTHQGTPCRTKFRTTHERTCTRRSEVARTCRVRTYTALWRDMFPWSCSYRLSSRCSDTHHCCRTHLRGHTRCFRARGTRCCSHGHGIRYRTHTYHCHLRRRSTYRGQSTYHHQDTAQCTLHHSTQLNTDRMPLPTSGPWRGYWRIDKYHYRTFHHGMCRDWNKRHQFRQSGDRAIRTLSHNAQRRSPHSQGRCSVNRMCIHRCRTRRRRTRHDRCKASTTHRGTRTGTYRPSTHPHSRCTHCHSSGLGVSSRGSDMSHRTSRTSRCTRRVRHTRRQGTLHTAECSGGRASRSHTHYRRDRTRNLSTWMRDTHMCHRMCTYRGGSMGSARLRGIRRCSSGRCSRMNIHIHSERDGNPNGRCRARSTQSQRLNLDTGRHTTYRSIESRKCTWHPACCTCRGSRMSMAENSSRDRSHRHTHMCQCRTDRRCRSHVRNRAWRHHQGTHSRIAARTCQNCTVHTHCRRTGKHCHMHHCCMSTCHPHMCRDQSTQ
eukprot:PhM_4_TR17373/c2_g1_i1/m.73064